VPQDLVGRSIEHYRFTGHLGPGGMGEVYRARASRLELREGARVPGAGSSR
jgi:hypothetical protein